MTNKETRAREVLNLPKLGSGNRLPNLKELQILWALFCEMSSSTRRHHVLSAIELERLAKKLQCGRLTESKVRTLVGRLRFINVDPIITAVKVGRRSNIGTATPIEEILAGIYKYTTLVYAEEQWKVPPKYRDILPPQKNVSDDFTKVIKSEKIFRPTQQESKKSAEESKKVEEKKEEKSLKEIIPSLPTKSDFGRKQFAIAIFLNEYGARSFDQISEFLMKNTWYRYMELGKSELLNFPEYFEQLPDGRFKLRSKLEDLPYSPKSIIKETWYIENGKEKIELINEFFPAEADWNPNIIFILRDDTISSRTELSHLLDQLGENDYPIGKHTLIEEIKGAGIMDSILLNAEKNL